MFQDAEKLMKPDGKPLLDELANTGTIRTSFSLSSLRS